MDIKSWILVIGSLLIVAVICHGFWTAYRSRREPFRLDIAPDIPTTDVDDLALLRGELPNGGARSGIRGVTRRARAQALGTGPETPDDAAWGAHQQPQQSSAGINRNRHEQQIQPSQSAFDLTAPGRNEVGPLDAGSADAPLLMDAADTPEPIVEFPETALQRRVATKRNAAKPGKRVAKSATEPRAKAHTKTEQKPGPEPVTQELIVLNVLAKNQPFDGGDLLEMFLRNGIKFGEMNIFHRVDPVSKLNQFSIASVTEPGTFDLRSMDEMSYKGLCLFMRLPCAGQATKVFSDLLNVAEKLATKLDGEVCDEQYNRLTRQSTEHFRQRVAEFTRRNMSKRA